MSGDLYALDFDGVLCDSCGESSLSALKAAKIRWPTLFEGLTSEIEEWIIDQMHVVAEGLNIDDILMKWSGLKPVIMEEWGEKSSDLVNLFGCIRDEWIDRDLSGWIDANRFYPGIADALRFASSIVYVVTTKQSRFADILLRELAGVTIPAERIYGLGTGPKVEVLKKLQTLPEHQGLKLHFVEDRLATLKTVIKEPALDGWNLYLGRWGYNTEKERKEAESIQRIKLLDLSDFSSKLK